MTKQELIEQFRNKIKSEIKMDDTEIEKFNKINPEFIKKSAYVYELHFVDGLCSYGKYKIDFKKYVFYKGCGRKWNQIGRLQ